MIAIITAWALTLLGAATLAGGAWLAAMGGSPFYIVMGVGLLTTGVLLMRRHRLVRWVYAVFLAFVLAWALFEIGFDWWALVPRGVFFTLVGLWLLLPWFGPACGEDGTRAPDNTRRSGYAALSTVIAAAAFVAVAAIQKDASAIDGTVDKRRFALAGAEPVAGNDWPFYGGDRYGRRCSSLDDIHAGNVADLKVA